MDNFNILIMELQKIEKFMVLVLHQNMMSVV